VTRNEFDLHLMDDLSELPPANFIVADATPWRSAMEKIMWGIALNVFQLEFFYLQYILPLLGSVLMYLGFRSLRKENRPFALCWLLSAYFLVRHAVVDVLAATPILQTISKSAWNWPLIVLNALTTLVLFLSLRAGIRQAFAAAGGENPRDWIGRAILARIGSYALAVWSTLVPLTEPSAFFGPQIMDEWQWLYYGRSIAFIALEIFVLVCISKQTRALAGRGYQITPVPVKFTARTVLLGVFAAVLLAIPPVSYLSSHVSMPEAEVPEQKLTHQQEVTKNRLVAMALPQELADILAPSELDACAGAVCVHAPVSLSTYLKNEESSDFTNFALRSFAGLETRLSAWTVLLPGEKNRVYQWFEYTRMPDTRLQEQFSIDPSGNYPHSDYAARLVWTENGIPYACTPEVHLAGGTTREELEASNWAGVIFREETERELDRLGGHLHRSPWIDYTIPKKADTMRGYLAFSTDISSYFARESEYSFYDFYYYALRHQTGFLHYPFGDLSDLGGATGSYMNAPGESLYGSVNIQFEP